MVLAIIAIALFQCYWLYKTYGDERETLNIRTNVLFRESIFESQAARFTLEMGDSTKGPNRVEAIRVIDNIRNRFERTDSLPTTKGQVFVKVLNRSPGNEALLGRVETITGDRLPDSLPGLTNQTLRPLRKFNITRKGDVFYDVLQDLDFVHDSSMVPDIRNRLQLALTKEGIEIEFVINKNEMPANNRRTMENLVASNEVIIGFSKPVRFTLTLQNAKAYLVKKMLPQIVVSLLLVSLTTVSFIVLFRNLIRQRKLTQLKNDFISNITHELKTPIATVSVAVEALKNFNALNDPKRTDEYLSISANELKRLSLLVDKVLKLSMFEKQEIELTNETFDLKQLIAEVVASMRLQCEKYEAVISMDLPAQPAFLHADRLHITSVIYNLLDNALKYSRSLPVIRIGIKEDARQYELAVQDNGPGIADEYKTKIFDKFFRVPTGDHHNVKGYGLGLSYVTYVIQRHHGRIAVQSETGVGSTFTITLPKQI